MPSVVFRRRLAVVAPTLIAGAGGYVAAANLFMAGCSLYALNEFDGALFQLQVLYAARGLSPYADYGFLYPPGPAFVLGWLLRIDSSEALNAVTWGAVAAVVAVNAGLAGTAAGGRVGGWAARGACLLVSAWMAPTWASSGSEPLTPHLMLTAHLLVAQALQAKPVVRAARGATLAVAFVLTMLRWDRMPLIVATGVLAWAVAGLAWYVSGRRPPDLGRLLENLFQLIVAQIVGTMLGALAILGVGAALADVDAVVDFVFRLPYVIRSYRTLPLPHPTGLADQSIALYLAVAAVAVLIGVAALAAVRQRRRSGEIPVGHVRAAIVATLPLASLPYALNRPDPIHVAPLFYLTLVALSWIAADARRGAVSAHHRWLAGALAAALAIWAVNVDPGARHRTRIDLASCGTQQRLLERDLEQCRSLVPEAARSIFVGRTSYARYRINFASLYFTDLDLTPASRYISDEPGLQNECEYGARVVGDLRAAPRPMVALLDSTPQIVEANRTRDMGSCGRIEQYLADTAFDAVGSCRFATQAFEVRVYR
jgi:hypothetical protein